MNQYIPSANAEKEHYSIDKYQLNIDPTNTTCSIMYVLSTGGRETTKED